MRNYVCNVSLLSLYKFNTVSKRIILSESLFVLTGTYKDGLAPDGKILSDHMLLGSVVATILIIDNTTQVRINYFI